MHAHLLRVNLPTSYMSTLVKYALPGAPLGLKREGAGEKIHHCTLVRNPLILSYLAGASRHTVGQLSKSLWKSAERSYEFYRNITVPDFFFIT
jgi:hypothetical protein